MSTQPLKNSHISTNLPAAIFPALLLGLNWLVFGAWAVYAENPEEFLVTYNSMVWTVVIPALVVFVGAGLLSVMLKQPSRMLFNSILVFLALATYVHGNWLSWNTGVLDGNQLDFSESWRSWVDALVWASLAYVIIRCRKWFLQHGWQLFLLLIVFQTIGLVGSLLQFKAPTQTEITTFPVKMETFSAKKNVVHIVLDGFQGNVFEQLSRQHPELAGALEGFTFFRDAVTSSDVTYLSIPATLSGKKFDNQTSISNYLEQTLQGDNLYRVMAAKQFAVDVATPFLWNKPEPWFSSYLRIPTPYAGKQQIRTSTLYLLLDLSLFRQVPHFLKPAVYNSGSWLLSGTLIAKPEQQFQTVSHLAFLTDMQSRISVTSNQPRYKFMHIVTPHAPLVTKADCSFSGKPREYGAVAYTDQAWCAIQAVVAFLAQLKTKGIYDNSLILIHGDHGGGVPFSMSAENGESTNSFKALHHAWGNPLPLVLLKPAGAIGEMRISDKQIQLTDIAKTVSDAMGFENSFSGISMLADNNAVDSGDKGSHDDGEIKRMFYTSSMHSNDALKKDHFDDFSGYQIFGSIFDVGSWSLVLDFAAPVLNETQTYNWSTKLSFGSDGNFKPFIAAGWTSNNNPESTWSVGPNASIAIDFGFVESDVLMRAQVKPLLVAGRLEQQLVNIYVGANKAGEWRLNNKQFQQAELLLPAYLFNENGTTSITFEFPDAASPASLGTSRDERQLGVAFSALQFDLLEK